MAGLSRRTQISRTIRAFFRLPGSTVFVGVLIGFVVVMIAAVLLLYVSYTAAEVPQGLTLVESIYAVFGMLILEHIYPFPSDALSRVLYVVVPVVGGLMVVQLLVRLGAAAVNRERWEMAKASTYSDHVIVCGIGRVGFRVVRWLLDLGEEVVVIDLREEEDLLHDQVRGWGVPIISADARRPEILTQAGIGTASAIVPITEDDLVNLGIATAARSLRPGMRVVMRTFDDTLAANLQAGFDIHRAYSASALAAPAFAAAALHAPVDYAFAYTLDDDDDSRDTHDRALITITEFTVVAGSRFVGYTLARLQEEFHVSVLAHRTDRFEVHPSLDRVLADDDGFVVSATPEELDRLARYTPPTREMRRYLDGRRPIES